MNDTWLKLHTSLLSSEKYVSLPSNDHRVAFVSCLILQKKGLIFAAEEYVSAHVFLSKTRWKRVRKDLIDCGLLNADGSVYRFEEHQVTPEALRKQRQRERENVTDNDRDLSRQMSREKQKQKQKAEKKEDKVGLAADEVLSHLNSVTGKSYRNAKDIAACIKREGCTVDQCRAVIDHKWAEWGADPKMEKHVNPTTPFRPSHFRAYLDEAQAGPGTAPMSPEERERKERLDAIVRRAEERRAGCAEEPQAGGN